MNPKKWKSVVIPVDVYHALKRLAQQERRTISGQFTFLLEQVMEDRQKETAYLKEKDSYREKPI